MADDDIKTVVVLDDASFDVIETNPPEGSNFIKAMRKEVLENLELSMVIRNLDRTNELLYVAACGVAGSKDTTLSGKISKLQFELARACSASSLTMLKIRDASGEIIDTCQGAFRWLYRNPPEEERMLFFLSDCAEKADTMATEAVALATTFDGLSNQCQDALTSTLGAREVEEQTRREAIDRRAKLEADDTGAQTKRDELKTAIEDMQRQVEDAAAAQAKAEDRAFGLAITSAITSTISSGVQAFAAVNSAPALAGANLASAVAQGIRGNSGQANPAEPAKPAEAARPAEPSTAVGTAKPVETARGDETAKADAKPAANDAAKAPEAGTSATGVAKPAQDETAKAAALGVAAAASIASKQTDQMAQSYDAIAERTATEKKHLQDLLFAMKKEQRDALEQIAKYAKLIENSKIDETSAKTAVDCLQQAVAALKQVVTALLNASFFWGLIAKACRKLADDKRIKKQVEMIAKDPPEKRLREYQDKFFLKDIGKLMGRWYALELIADEFSQAILKTTADIKTTINKSPTIEEAKKLAPELGKKLALEMSADVASLDAELKAMKPEGTDAAAAEAPKVMVPA
ncbi:MAG TPA: hypothetical protein VFH89_04850 [Sphingomicrobium sp.]|nr:hypothetical protein [Sphingomicrobium sp.]